MAPTLNEGLSSDATDLEPVVATDPPESASTPETPDGEISGSCAPSPSVEVVPIPAADVESTLPDDATDDRTSDSAPRTAVEDRSRRSAATPAIQVLDLASRRSDRVPALPELLTTAVKPRDTVVVTAAIPARLVSEVVARLSTSRGQVEALLFAEPIGVPIPHVAEDQQYTVEALPTRFRLPDGQPQTLTAVLPLRSSSANHSSIDDADRIEIARLLCRTLDALHAGDVVTTGFTSDSFAVTLRPRPELWFLRPDQLRPLGGEPLDGSHAWRGADEDRADLARLLEELLPDGIARTVMVAESRQQMSRLLDQAGRRGQRPTAARWLEVLSA
ncbi:hypothetical protein K8Z61_13030 [Nocardioides sp. TRM66260-LWL]|uniref:hypothetical protein n=1 Tax=Nocardioides sp. TRM66260-LWL TaxID=2874478 RepID=UPI001CC36D71|nr:hypothetical protein [Nocardioides sp. TRM66260-LWL]MBZ5735422.1 hypothetical protein [Nocardioides sp. TRM66260-LWL]